MELTNVIGLLAGALTTSSFFPQLIKVWKTKSVKDVSLWMFIMLCTGLLLWIVYGFLIHSLPVIITNAVTFVPAWSILVLKLKYDPSPGRRGKGV